MKSIKKFLMLGVLAAMTAFCLAPGFALADEGGEKPLSFDADGVCNITEGGTYYLAADTTGRVVVTGKVNVTINLNGHTLTNETADQPAMYFEETEAVTINAGKSEDGEKVGTIAQACSGGAIRYDSTWNADNSGLTLNDVKVTAQDNQCLQLMHGKCELNDVDMSNTGGDSLIYLGYNNGISQLTINSGKFAAGGSAEMFKIKEGGSVALKGGSFNKIPEGYATKTDGSVVPPSIGEGFAMFKAKDSSDYVVDSEGVVKGKSVAKVVLDDCRTVYFASLEEAKSCADGVTDAKLVEYVKATIEAPENCVYNGEAKQAQWSLKSVADGTDVEAVEAVVEYTKNGAKVDEAKEVGNYTAKVTGLEGDDAASYELTNNPSVDFVITEPDTNINKNSFDKDGKYEITQAGTYNLTEDVTGAIYVGNVHGATTIKLNGHTIKNTNSNNNVLFAYVLTNAVITVDGADDAGNNGTIEQTIDGKGAIRLESSGTTTFNLSNLDVKAQSNECLQAENGKSATLTNVNMAVSGTADAVIFVKQLSTSIESGAYKASDSMDAIFKIDAQAGSGSQNALTVNGGSFNKFPAGTTLASGKTLYKEANGDYKAVSTDDACLTKHCWKVTLTDQTQILYSGDTKDIYFSLESEAKAFAGSKYAVEEINAGAAIELTDDAVSLSPDSYTYDGTQKEPTVSVSVGGSPLTEGEDYVVSYESNINPGTAYAVVEGVNGYKGTVKKPFTIVDKATPVSTNISAAKVTLSKTAFTYNGKAQKPSVKSVVLNGKTLKAGTDYTASIASGKKVGTYSVTIAAKGSYTGKATASFVVNPKGVTKFKVTKAKKSFKAKWKKNKTERSGVQVKYSTKKSMKNAKTVKAKGASVKAKKVKKLKKKTKYYVQVRAYKVVNGKTYYSSWSSKKAVKTK